MRKNIKPARKRRKLTAIQITEREDIARSTLSLVEKGEPGVDMDAFLNVLRVLRL